MDSERYLCEVDSLPHAPDDGRGKRLNQHIPTGDTV
jgi:hypothetical protein